MSTLATFAAVSVPAIDCPLDCPADLASEVLRSFFESAGQCFLTESDVLSSLAVANVDVGPLAFGRDLYKHADHEHKLSRSYAVDAHGRKRRSKIGAGFFSEKTPIHIFVD